MYAPLLFSCSTYQRRAADLITIISIDCKLGALYHRRRLIVWTRHTDEKGLGAISEWSVDFFSSLRLSLIFHSRDKIDYISICAPSCRSPGKDCNGRTYYIVSRQYAQSSSYSLYSLTRVEAILAGLASHATSCAQASNATLYFYVIDWHALDLILVLIQSN